MELIKKKLEKIIADNRFENVICRPVESRPGELAKYISALTNKEGGYILIGTERDNGSYRILGFQLGFDMERIMKIVSEKLSVKVKYIYGSTSIFGENIFVVRVEKSEEYVMADKIFYSYKNNDAEAFVPKEPATLFISYTECDTPIAEIIERAIHDKLGDRIKVSRYTRLDYKASFKEFMNTIQDHDFVLTIVGDKYLKSQACMYEVGEIIKDHHFKDKLLFIVLSEAERKYYGESAPEKIAATVYKGPEEKLEYVDYWKKKFDSLHGRMRQINDLEAIARSTNDLKIIGKIYREDIGGFLEYLSDANGKNFQELYDAGFDDILKWINVK